MSGSGGGSGVGVSVEGRVGVEVGVGEGVGVGIRVGVEVGVGIRIGSGSGSTGREGATSAVVLACFPEVQVGEQWVLHANSTVDHCDVTEPGSNDERRSRRTDSSSRLCTFLRMVTCCGRNLGGRRRGAVPQPERHSVACWWRTCCHGVWSGTSSRALSACSQHES